MNPIKRLKEWRAARQTNDNVGKDEIPQDSTRTNRVKSRRDFRINRLEQRTKLASARKWMWIALAIIAIVVGVLVMKFGFTGGLL